MIYRNISIPNLHANNDKTIMLVISHINYKSIIIFTKCVSLGIQEKTHARNYYKTDSYMLNTSY